MTIKPPLFAAAGVPEMWVVDVERQRLEVFADPRDGEYTKRATHAAPGHVAAERLDIEPLDLTRCSSGSRTRVRERSALAADEARLRPHHPLDHAALRGRGDACALSTRTKVARG